MPKISLRMEDSLYNLIDDYAAFTDNDFSKALRSIIVEGLMAKTQAKLLLNWNEKTKERPLVLDNCDKCFATDNLQFYHINGDINDFSKGNIAVLCNGDLRKLQKSIMKNNLREKFLRWFYLEI